MLVMAKSLDSYRKQLYMNVDEFAAHLGISLRTLYRIREGEPTRFSTMKKVAAKLGVPPRDITEFIIPDEEEAQP